jgi:ribosomal protein S18 acetylase RimI-like enzyme
MENEIIQSESLFEEVCICLKYSEEVLISSWDNDKDPSEYNYDISGDIVAIRDEGCDVSIGSFRISKFKVWEACRAGVDLFDLFDEHSSVAEMMYGTLFNDSQNGPRYKSVVKNNFPNAFPEDDILYIDHLELKPFARGQRIGLAVLREVINKWAFGNSLVMIYPAIIENRSDAYELSLQEKKSLKKLINYYKNLGFKSVGRSGFLAMDSAMVALMPTLRQLKVPRKIQIKFPLDSPDISV